MDYNRNLEETGIRNGENTAGEENAASPVFTVFMNEMITRYRVKRSDISRITGISQDYLYKILSGTKHTAQRDYVIAICCAIGMNAGETGHALTANGMPQLNANDQRDSLILDCLDQSVSLYKLNDRLEKAGYPWLRFSKDMEEYIPE